MDSLQQINMLCNLQRTNQTNGHRGIPMEGDGTYLVHVGSRAQWCRQRLRSIWEGQHGPLAPRLRPVVVNLSEELENTADSSTQT